MIDNHSYYRCYIDELEKEVERLRMQNALLLQMLQVLRQKLDEIDQEGGAK